MADLKSGVELIVGARWDPDDLEPALRVHDATTGDDDARFGQVGTIALLRLKLYEACTRSVDGSGSRCRNGRASTRRLSAREVGLTTADDHDIRQHFKRLAHLAVESQIA